MYTSIIIFSLVTVVSLCVVAAVLFRFVTLVQVSARSRFFNSRRSVVGGRSGRIGVSLLCVDDGDITRLSSLLAVEYPDYEVIMVADSLRNPDSLPVMIRRYRMVAVDGRIFTAKRGASVRKMYRSANRCYRRLILLDVATTGSRSDLDVACEVATYDLLLPIWGAERLTQGAIERIVTELSAVPNSASQIVIIGYEEEFLLIPARVAQEYDGVSAVGLGRGAGRYRIREQLVCGEGSAGRRNGRLLMVALGGVAVLCVVAIAAGIAVDMAGVILLTLGLIMIVAYAASRVARRGDSPNVGYGGMLYVFCKKMLPQIWQIRK